MENYKLNDFFRSIRLKKQYINKLKNEATHLNKIKNKTYNYKLKNLSNIKKANLVKYIIDIKFSRTNTLLHVMDFSGNLKFYCSAGKLNYKGKSKKARKIVLRDIYKILVSKLNYLLNQPVALHLKNVSYLNFWIIKLLKKKFFINVIKTYKYLPYNGCRKKKVRRKKLRTKKQNFKRYF